jgi:outer membrane protein assembly factor BamB
MGFGTAGRGAHGRRCLSALAALVVALGVGVGGCGEGSEGGSSAVPADASWPAPNGDPANHRHVDGAIDAASVDRLKVAWKVPLAAGYAATPIVLDGVVYTQDLQSNVYAVELDSGRVLWTKGYGESDIGPNGVNVVDERVFGATATRAFALDAKTGRELWGTTLVRHPGDTIDMAPGYKDGTLYVSTAVSGPGAVGTLWALDAETGKPRWSWEQVPADLWGHPEINSGGGMWHPPAFDGEGNLYASIANPLPFPGRVAWPWGASRPGPNRWTNSLVKLDARSGKLLWGRQVLPHDVYDWDLEGPTILDRVDGRLIALTSGKMGFVYAFDAGDGTLLWKRSVGQHNGHDRDNLLAMRAPERLPKLPQRILPGWWGGVETQMASDGRTVFVPVNDFPIVWRNQERFHIANPLAGTGELVAIDVASGRVRWERKLPHTPYGAATIASDLVFTTTYDGTVWALRRSSGEIVWTSHLPGGTNAPLAVAGDALVAAASVPLRPGEQPVLVAYRLDDGSG